MERIFEVVDGDSVIEGVVISPDPQIISEAQSVYNKAFREALDNGAYLWQKFASILVSQGIWTEDKDRRITTLQLYIRREENRLKNKDQTEEEAREIALKIRKYREELKELVIEQNSFSDQTAEGQADTKRFNFLCSKCILLKETRKPYFSSLEDYLAKANTKMATEGSKYFGCLINDIDPDYEEKYPEEIFFKRFGEDTEGSVSEEDKELQQLLNEIISEENDLDMNTIEYSKKKKRGRPKKVD